MAVSSNDVSNSLTAGISEIKFELQGLKDGFQELKTDVKEIKAEIQTLAQDTAINSAKIEMLGHSIYWGFAIVALVVAYVGIFRPEKSEKKAKEPELTTSKVQAMIDEAIARALTVK